MWFCVEKMFLSKQKKNQGERGNRLLVSVTVMGSAGPIRFVVDEKELVANVIDMVLKCYAREGRLPVLGSKIDYFVLYSPIAGTEGIIIVPCLFRVLILFDYVVIMLCVAEFRPRNCLAEVFRELNMYITIDKNWGS